MNRVPIHGSLHQLSAMYSTSKQRIICLFEICSLSLFFSPSLNPWIGSTHSISNGQTWRPFIISSPLPLSCRGRCFSQVSFGIFPLTHFIFSVAQIREIFSVLARGSNYNGCGHGLDPTIYPPSRPPLAARDAFNPIKSQFKGAMPSSIGYVAVLYHLIVFKNYYLWPDD